MIQFKLACLFICLSLILLACSNLPISEIQVSQTDTTSLPQLLSLRQPDQKNQASKLANRARLMGLKEIAISLGAQGALAGRSKTINETLEKNHAYLDQVFNFEVLMLDHQVLPPILVEGRRTLDKSDDTTIRLSDKTYRIVQQARFATTVPHWRNYLLMTYTKPDLPEFTMLPRNGHDDEVEAWIQGINEGWQQGSRQATEIFNENLSRLKRDYQGMLLYHKLVKEKMITPPFVAKVEMGVTGGGEELTINDRFKRITGLPSLNSNSSEWQPAVAMPVTSIGNKAKIEQKPTRMVPQMRPDRVNEEETEIEASEEQE